MACSTCGKAVSYRAGNSPATAIVLGDPTPVILRVRVLRVLPGLPAGAVKYVRGENVDALVQDGSLMLLAGSNRVVAPGTQTTLYYVGDVGYTTIDAARVQSQVTGEDIVVRTFA
jgi:hypothetical protein